MKRRSYRKRAYFLLALLMALVVAAPAATVLGWILLTAVRAQGLAAEHARRGAVMDNLMHCLRSDALACQRYEREDMTLTLEICDRTGVQEVRYELWPDVVRRTTADGDVREWRARRLAYEWEAELGPTGDLLLLHFIEQPPPDATDVPSRTYVLPVLLPVQRGALRGTEGGS